MGLFGSSSRQGKCTPGASSSRAPPPPPPPLARVHPGRRRLRIPVHQARWHWEHRQPLPYPDVTLLHHRHLDPHRIPEPAVPQTQRAHDEEVRRCRAQLTPAQRRMPEYAADSPNWEAWFALEHEEQWRLGVDANPQFPLPPPRVEPEEMEAEAEYQAALEQALQHALEASRIDEDAHWDGLEQALAFSTAGDFVHTPLFVPPPPPPPPSSSPSRIRSQCATAPVRVHHGRVGHALHRPGRAHRGPAPPSARAVRFGPRRSRTLCAPPARAAPLLAVRAPPGEPSPRPSLPSLAGAAAARRTRRSPPPRSKVPAAAPLPPAPAAAALAASTAPPCRHPSPAPRAHVPCLPASPVPRRASPVPPPRLA
nr:tropomyosin-1, isoforms 33/34-like [Aegilops tauschii subsp. strangulata]